MNEKEDEWVRKEAFDPMPEIKSSIEENEFRFNYRQPVQFEYERRPLYHEMTFIDLQGQEKVKVTTSDFMDTELKDVSQRKNTFIKAETYFEELKELEIGEIYVSEVIGEYVGSRIIGRYIPENAKKVGIPFEPENSAYANQENPLGKRFRGIVRWATPVEKDGEKIGYVTLALDHDHIMEFTDRLMPTRERYTEISDAYAGNYAFIWDYKGRSIVHPRHFSIVGYDSETGDPQVPWLEDRLYNEWQESGKSYAEYIKDVPTFFEQSNSKRSAPELTKAGLVGLDCRYLNFAAQCTGWFDLTKDGGSGSFVILWSDLWKLNTAAAIPYYTGRYGESKRGFGFVAIGAEVDDFHQPAMATKKVLDELMANTDASLNTLAENTYKAINENLLQTATRLSISTALMAGLVILIAIWMASIFTKRITYIINGITTFREGKRDFRFNAEVKDEMGALTDAFDDMAENLVRAESDPLVITDLDRKILYMNKQSLALVDKNADEVMGKDYFDISVFPARGSFCPISSLLDNREADVLYIEKNNTYLRGDASYLTNAKGEKIGYLITSKDVTSLILNSKRIEAQKALLDTVVNYSPDLIWYKDTDDRFIMVNPRFTNLLGYSAEEFIGKKADEVLPAKYFPSFAVRDSQAIADGRPFYSEDKISFADGHVEVLDVVRTPLYDTDGNYHGLLGVARDVSQRVEVENTLRQTQKDLEDAVLEANAANASKSIFLARMSHEIRTPMNAIIGMGNIVSRKLKSDKAPIGEVRAHVRQIEMSSQHLLGLINDILDISKIEAGKIDLSYESFDLKRLVRNVVTIISPRCQEKDLNFKLHMEPEIPFKFKTDTLRLRQVMINLLGNAVKFTAPGGNVDFRVNCLEENAKKALISFSVTDTGIGISPSDLIKIGFLIPLSRLMKVSPTSLGELVLVYPSAKILLKCWGEIS